MRRRRLLVGLGIVCVALWVVVAVVLVRRDDGDRSASDGGQDYPRIREELLEGIQPDPSCPDAEPFPTPGTGEVLVTVARAVDGCLRYSGETVPEDEVDDRIEERRTEPDVVAADRAVERPLVGVGGLPDRPRQDEPDQWALAPEHLGGEEVRSLWPADAAEVRVAVLDSGIDPDHPDLAGQIVERVPWAQGGGSEHGTHIAGVVAAADDGAGVVGLTPAARLMDVQYKGEDGWAGPAQELGEYIRWAVDHGADVLNMSFGDGEASDSELAAVLYAELRGVVLIAGAGNCGLRVERMIESCGRHNEVFYPAAHEQVLSVANHNEDGERDMLSTVNATVDIAAPGTDIVSTCPTEGSDTRRTCELGGTSMATPFVAATAALLRARQPDATPAAIREAIISSARTEHHQPVGTRTDELGWGLLDPAAAAEYLDAHPGDPQPSVGPPADRTQAAYVHDGTLYAFDGQASNPVREVGSDHSIQSIVWSADHSRLVGADDTTLFSWGGPGSDVVEVPCDQCSYNEVAYFDDIAVTDPADTATGDLVVTLAADGTLTRWSPATLEPQGTVALGVSGVGGDGSAVLQGAVGDSLLVLVSGGVGHQDVLWRVDPFSGQGQASHDLVGGWGGRTATNAADTLVAYVNGGSIGGTCNDVEEAVVLDAGSLSPVADPDLERNVVFDEIFFGGDTLYATGERIEVNADGACPTAGTAGLWRATGEELELVDAGITAARPLEGMADGEPTGWIAVTEDEEGYLVRNSVDSLEDGEPLGAVDFGSYTEGLWATPTSEEVALEGSGGGGSPSSGGGGGGGGDPTDESVEGAIARYEDFLHALGEEDIDTVCEIAGPAAQIAEDEGFGPCEQTFAIVFDMISDEQAAALREATVDPARVEQRGSGEVDIPVEAIVADVTFGEDELGDSTLRYQDDNWFVVE